MTQDSSWQRHRDLYMPDGTVVLLADSTLFRVYAGLLAKNSGVFGRLMEYPPNPTETYDGCVLIRVQDNPEDLAHLLKATLGLLHFDGPRGKSTPFRIASAILRLSTKYMIKSLRRDAIEHFRRAIPQSYDEIGKVEPYAKVFGIDQPHPFQLIPLFRACGLMSFLPWAYYVACGLGFETLLQGEAMYGIRLDAHDTNIALSGWKSLCEKTHEIRRSAIMSSAVRCQKGSSCADHNMRLAWLQSATKGFDAKALQRWGMFEVLSLPPGQVSPQIHSVDQKAIRTYGRPCQLCIAEWLQQEKTARASVWSQLPEVFQLSDAIEVESRAFVASEKLLGALRDSNRNRCVYEIFDGILD